MNNPLEQPMDNFYTQEPKSSIKIIKNSRGLNWEIKIVQGEESLIDELMNKAVTIHEALELKFKIIEREDKK